MRSCALKKECLRFYHEFLKKLCNDYINLDVDGFLVWIASFEEANEPVSLLQGMKNLFQILSSSGKDVINLHGGYYSILLRHFGLKGFASGICNKDSADPESFPTGGLLGEVPSLDSIFLCSRSNWIVLNLEFLWQ